jgi:hypothetical protein
MMHFIETADQLIRGLKEFPSLGGGNAREGGGHVEQIPLVERRHELRA